MTGQTGTCSNSPDPSGQRAVPAGRVPRRHTAQYLRVETDLAVGMSGACGELVEIEAVWEPLGWVLDDWIDTIALAPGEHSAVSATDVSGSARFSGETSGWSGARTGAAESSSVSTQEIMRLATNVLTSGRGVSAGLSASSSGVAPGRVSVDPVASLAQAVTGSFQLGYSSATASTTGTYGEDVEAVLRTALDRVTTQLRSSRSRNASDSVGQLIDHRRLRVVRNPSATRVLNLAVFSLAYRWSVRTRETSCSRVVFVAVKDLEEEFTPEEVFRDRAVLRGVLLDPELAGTLDAAAGRYRVPVVDPPQMDRIEGWVTFSDPAKQGGRVSVVIEVNRSGENVQRLGPDELRPGRPGPYMFTIGTRGYRPDELLSAVLTMRANPNSNDRRAVVSKLELYAVFDDGRRCTVLERAEDIVLTDGSPRPLSLERTPVVDPDPTGDMTRVLDHLNTYRHYYRFAVDLQRDAVSRFVDLQGRTPPVWPFPLDMNPVGVAGAHIAFLCRSEKPDPEPDPKPDPPSPMSEPLILATPCTGLFVDTVPGSGSVQVEPLTSPPCELPVGKDGGFAWPASTVLPVGASVPAAVEDPVPAPSGPAAAPASEPATKADLAGLAESLMSRLGELVGAAKDAIPADAGTDEKKTTGRD